jgi:hypothetical protein
MKKEFANYEQSLAVKELGFDEQCFSFYDSDGELYESEGYYKKGYNVSDEEVIAPLKQQAFRWFRENYNVLAAVYSNASGYLYEWHDSIGGTHRGWSEYEGPNDSGVWDTYEEAEDACIDKLIEIIKQK